VSWVSGSLAPADLARLDVPVLLDGAQSAGAVPVDLPALGCAAYAASGQKWLCGPDGTGLLYVRPDFGELLAPVGASYLSFAEPYAGLDAPLHHDARRFDAPVLPAEALAMGVASIEVLSEAGWDAVRARGRLLASQLADALRARGHDVLARGETTLVSWRSADAAAMKDRFAQSGVIVRELPGRDLLRASVGAWNDESDLDRLLHYLGDPSNGG
jgi:L-cysteine/cystine lyase